VSGSCLIMTAAACATAGGTWTAGTCAGVDCSGTLPP
jgi:hypothetical protein